MPLDDLLDDFSVSQSAAEHIHKTLQKKQDEGVDSLRLRVTGGGCSGFQYNFSFDKLENKSDDDLVFKTELKNSDNPIISVIVDSESLELVKGSTLDFVDDLLGSSFRVENPKAVAACGCGTSFSLF